MHKAASYTTKFAVVACIRPDRGTEDVDMDGWFPERWKAKHQSKVHSQMAFTATNISNIKAINNSRASHCLFTATVLMLHSPQMRFQWLQ